MVERRKTLGMEIEDIVDSFEMNFYFDNIDKLSGVEHLKKFNTALKNILIYTRYFFKEDVDILFKNKNFHFNNYDDLMSNFENICEEIYKCHNDCKIISGKLILEIWSDPVFISIKYNLESEKKFSIWNIFGK